MKNFFGTNQPEMVYSGANLPLKVKFEKNCFEIFIDLDHKRKFSILLRVRANVPRRIPPSVFIGFESEFFHLKAQNVNFAMMQKKLSGLVSVFNPTQPQVVVEV